MPPRPVRLSLDVLGPSAHDGFGQLRMVSVNRFGLCVPFGYAQGFGPLAVGLGSPLGRDDKRVGVCTQAPDHDSGSDLRKDFVPES